MSRKCAVCGGDTQILKNEHNRVTDFRLCGGECREKWFNWMKACKAHAQPLSPLYPITEKMKPKKGIRGRSANIIIYDENGWYDSGDV